jgi:hypothetical protein
MNRFTPAVPVVLVLSAWSLAALAADEAPSTAPPVTATTATPPASKPGKVDQPSASTASSSHASVRRLVCLNMSLQCFAVTPKQEDAPAKAQATSLDLKAPDIRRVATPMQLHEQEEPIDIDEQQVQVQGTRPEVYIPGGIASLPWAVVHPTQAWRIFLPVPAGQAK